MTTEEIKYYQELSQEYDDLIADGVVFTEYKPSKENECGINHSKIDNKLTDGGSVGSKLSYLMTLDEYQQSVTPILKDYYKFISKNEQYFVKSDYNGLMYYSFPEVLKLVEKGTDTGRFRRGEYDKNISTEEFTKKYFSYHKTGHFNKDYEHIDTPDWITEKKNEYIDKLKKYFTEEEIVRLIDKDETKSNKRSVRRAIDNDVYKKLLEQDKVKIEDIQKVVDSVGVKLPKKVFDANTLKSMENKAIYDKIYASMPKVNVEVLSKMVDEIKESFKPLEEEIYIEETSRDEKTIIKLIDKNEAEIYDIYEKISYYKKVFNITKSEERKRKFVNKKGEEGIATDVFFVGLSLKDDWKEIVSKEALTYIESLKVNLIHSIIENFLKITLPIESIEKISLKVGDKGMQGSYKFKFKNGSSFVFNTEAIGAGGYNIQRYHFRYITNFSDIILADGTKASNRVGIIENFSTKSFTFKEAIADSLDKIEKSENSGELVDIIYDFIDNKFSKFRFYKNLVKNKNIAGRYNFMIVAFNPNERGEVQQIQIILKNEDTLEDNKIKAKYFLNSIKFGKPDLQLKDGGSVL